MTAPSSDAGRSQPIRDDELDGLFGWMSTQFPLTLAVSGGPDSMALMLLMARWLRLTDLNVTSTMERQLVVVTVDHGLRSGSADEAAFVGHEAAALDFNHETLAWVGDKPQRGLQQAARSARYQLIGTFNESYWQANRIRPGRTRRGTVVTAHHLDDQAETVLMRLARGSGIDGLAGMRRKTVNDGLTILRPLLAIGKARLINTLTDAGADFANDPGNDNADFERVRLRQARAGLETAGLHNAQLARVAARAARASEALERATDDFARQAKLVIHDAGYAEMEFKAWCGAATELRLRLLGRLIRKLGGGDSGDSSHYLQLQKLEDLDRRLTESTSSETFAGATLGGCSFFIRRESLLVCREAGRDGLPSVTMLPGDQFEWDNRFMLRLAQRVPKGDDSKYLPVNVMALGGENWAALKKSHRSLARSGIPARVAATLPAFYGQTGNLLAVPSLQGYVPDLAGPVLDGVQLLDVRLKSSDIGY